MDGGPPIGQADVDGISCPIAEDQGRPVCDGERQRPSLNEPTKHKSK
ncbi:hypothetical protein CHELA1G11_11848 [Hyphomicrobiales bacterium]|nr:hypothetical protein CHELA1G11_11848 [Hyphomicrobiales bacterium]